jgi:hypothetical protein
MGLVPDFLISSSSGAETCRFPAGEAWTAFASSELICEWGTQEIRVWVMGLVPDFLISSFSGAATGRCSA